MPAVHGKHAVGCGRAYRADPSALAFDEDFAGPKPWRSIHLKEMQAFAVDDLREHVLNRQLDVHPLTPKEIELIQWFLHKLDWVLWSAVMLGRGFEWRKEYLGRVGVQI